MRPLTITRDIQIALAVWTAEIARSRRAYYADPTEAQQQAAQAKAVRKAAAQRACRAKRKKP